MKASAVSSSAAISIILLRICVFMIGHAPIDHKLIDSCVGPTVAPQTYLVIGSSLVHLLKHMLCTSSRGLRHPTLLHKLVAPAW